MTNIRSSQIYLLTPRLREADLSDFASTLASVLGGGEVACVLAR